MDPDPPRLPWADAETICGGSHTIYRSIWMHRDENEKYYHYLQTGFRNPPGATNKEAAQGTCSCSPEFLAEMYRNPEGKPFGLANAKEWLSGCSSAGDKTIGIQFRSRSTVR